MLLDVCISPTNSSQHLIDKIEWFNNFFETIYLKKANLHLGTRHPSPLVLI